MWAGFKKTAKVSTEHVTALSLAVPTQSQGQAAGTSARSLWVSLRAVISEQGALLCSLGNKDRKASEKRDCDKG